MRIFFLSPIGCYTKELFLTFIETFVNNGHTIVSNIEEADTIFLDLFSGLGNYDHSLVNYTRDHRLPCIIFDATDYGAMSKEIFYVNSIAHLKIKCKIIYFMRKMDKTISYPSWIYPYEVCYYKDHDFKPISKEELFNRPVDITFIGNQSPTRNNVCNGLINHFKCDFILGEERLEHEGWLNRHRLSKFFISADGGGYTDERAQQLFSIAPMIKQRNNQLVLNDFEDVYECVKVGDYEGNGTISALDISNIGLVISNQNWLYDMYLKGIHKMKTYFSEEFRANYILETLKKEGVC